MQAQAAAPASRTPALVVASTGGPVSTTPTQVLVTNPNSRAQGALPPLQQHPTSLTSPLSLNPHFPMFYHHTYLPTPTYQVPMATIQGTTEAEEDDEEDEEEEEEKDQ